MESNAYQVKGAEAARLVRRAMGFALGWAVGTALVLALVPESLELECSEQATQQAVATEPGERVRPGRAQIQDAVERSARAQESFLAKALRCQQAQ